MTTRQIIRSYSELAQLKTFRERFDYLKLNGEVAAETFGIHRYLNQRFYRSKEWKQVRDLVIFRDNGCDLGIGGFEIHGRILVHHMNPITVEDIEKRSDFLLNPEFLITTTHQTHNAIGYGDANLLSVLPAERTPNDTCPWKVPK